MMKILILTLLLLAFNPRLERGFVLDSEGNGISVDTQGNPVDEVYNYVCYGNWGVKAEKGTEILSIFLYDPHYIFRHEDDSIYRKDFVLSKGNDVSQYKPYTNRLYTSEVEIILDDGNIFLMSALLDNKGTADVTDDTFESIW